MNLKYERQWEIVEKIIKYKLINGEIVDWNENKKIIENIFELHNFVRIEYFWKIVENSIDGLNLESWEYQQKPLLDKMIEVTLWNKNKEINNND